MNKLLNRMLSCKLGITLAGLLAFTVSSQADTFVTRFDTFTIDFVTVGNPGNGDDAGAGGGIYSSPSGIARVRVRFSAGAPNRTYFRLDP